MLEQTIVLPKMTANFMVRLGKKDYQWSYNGQLPEEVMDAYKKVVGDGLAKVTVSSDFAIKTYGEGVSSMASVTLTCGQDAETLAKAADFASILSRDFAQKNALQAQEEFNQLKFQLGGGVSGTPKY